MKICGWRGRDGRQNLYGHVDFYDDDDEDDEISIDLCIVWSCGILFSNSFEELMVPRVNIRRN